MKYLSLSVGGKQIVNNYVPSGGLDKFYEILRVFIELAFIFAIILCLFMLVYSGFMWITSVGDKQSLERSRQRIIYSIVGLVVVFLSFFIINLFSAFLQVNLLNIDFPTGTFQRNPLDCPPGAGGCR